MVLAAKAASVEVFLDDVVDRQCNSTCIQGTLQALEDELPLCTAEFEEAEVPAFTLLDPGPCGDVYRTVQESECLVLQQLTTIVPSWIARKLYNSSAVSSDCLEWTRFLPRSAWTCAIAASQANGLDKLCPEECAYALAYAQAGVCTADELALLPAETIDAMNKAIYVAEPLCAAECVHSLPLLLAATTTCISSLAAGSVAATLAGDEACEEAQRLRAAMHNCTGVPPHAIRAGVERSCHEWVTAMPELTYGCLEALRDPLFYWRLADACPAECTAAVRLGAEQPCTEEDLAALQPTNGSTAHWADLNAISAQAAAKLGGLCLSDCLNVSLPAIRTLKVQCSIELGYQREPRDVVSASAYLAQSRLEEEPTPPTGSCMQLLAAVEASSCFTREELGGLLPPPIAARLAITLGVTPQCLDWAAQTEAAFDACRAAVEFGAGCPAECASALALASTQSEECAANEIWRLPPNTADLPYQIAAIAATACAGHECRNDRAIELKLKVDACSEQIDERFASDFCPIACLEVVELLDETPCLPPSLAVSYLPAWFGLLKTACFLKSSCEAEVVEIKPLMGACFSELVLLPPGTAHCHEECIAAAQLAEESECLAGLHAFADDLHAREDSIASSDYANSRSVTNQEKLVRALSTAVALRALGHTVEVAKSMCSAECTHLTSAVAAACEADMIAGSCSSDCYVAQYEAAQGCLEAAGVSESLANAWSLSGVTRSCELLCMDAVPSQIEALCAAPDSCAWECRAHLAALRADGQKRECLGAFERLGVGREASLASAAAATNATTLAAQVVSEQCASVSAITCPAKCAQALKRLALDPCAGKLHLILDADTLAAVQSGCAQHVTWLNPPPPASASPSPLSPLASPPAYPPFQPPFTPPYSPPEMPAALPPKGR